MGSSHSQCANLLQKEGWASPDLATEFHSPSLASLLQDAKLEVALPTHAPRADTAGGENKAAQYPRPAFCREASRMHVALLGPSTTCKQQILEFLPRLAHTFRAPSSRLGPGREAVPHCFFDAELHKLMLWELPEISWRQSPEDYIRELGLLYFDHVFIVFSEKYVLTDAYCKLCVALAIHGIPFFVICAQSGDVDQKLMRKIQSDFQQKGVVVRMLDMKNPSETLDSLFNDFCRDVSWNRNGDSGGASAAGGHCKELLGQTVRLKGLEKRPELNGRCGVCVGFDGKSERYLTRLVMDSVETDLALRLTNLTVVKPKLLGAVVIVKGLQSKPELNGCVGFVDDFLRDSERYRVFVTNGPSIALVLALKSENLERLPFGVTCLPASHGSQPAVATASAAADRAKAECTGECATMASGDASPSARDTPCHMPAAASGIGDSAHRSAAQSDKAIHVAGHKLQASSTSLPSPVPEAVAADTDGATTTRKRQGAFSQRAAALGAAASTRGYP